MVKRLLLVAVLLAPVFAFGQAGTTTVTATVVDLQGQAYSNCQWSVTFVHQNTTPGVGPDAPAALLNGQQGTCNSFGFFTVNLADNINTVTPTPSQWQFNICSASGYLAGPYCFQTLQTITGASQDLSSTFALLAPILPSISGVTFKVGGTPASSNKTINFIAGANMTITDGGGGNLTFASSGGGGGGSPGGSDTQMQLNAASSFGGATMATYNTTTGQTNIANQAAIRYLTSIWNWSRVDSAGSIGNLTVAGSGKTLTITCSTTAPCDGLDTTATAGVPFYVYIQTTGTPEAALVTGGTCSKAFVTTGTCTLIVTTVNAHPNGYTVGSAYAGWQEAYNDATQTNVSNVHLIAAPTNPPASIYYSIYAPIFFRGGEIDVDGAGATMDCNAKTACFEITNAAHIHGFRVSTHTNYPGAVITNTSCSANVSTITTTLNPTVGEYVDVQQTFNVHYWGVHQVATTSAGSWTYTDTNCGGAVTIAADNSTGGNAYLNAFAFYNTNAIGNHIDHILLDSPGGFLSQTLNNLVVVTNDQAFRVSDITMGSALSGCTTAYCANLIYAPGPFSTAAAVLYVDHINGSINCKGNGITAYNGNTVSVSDVVIQGFSQWAVAGGTLKGGFGGFTMTNVYNEVGNCTNPQYPGTGLQQKAMAGLLVQGGDATVRGGEFPIGNLPKFAATGNNLTQYNYWIVVRDSSRGASAPMIAGYASVDGTTPTGSITVVWPRVPGTSTITYDVIRSTGQGNTLVAPYNGGCTGGSTSACGSVTLSQAQCATSLCSFTDTASNSTTSYAVPTQAYYPFLPFWPGGLVMSPNSDNATSGSTQVANVDDLTFITNVSPIVSAYGTVTPSVSAPRCDVGVAGVWISCLSGNANGGTTAQVAGTLLQNGGSGSNPVPANSKGRLNFLTNPNIGISTSHIITLVDSNPGKTLNTAFGRPTNDANDTFIGLDQGSASKSVAQLTFGAPVSISNYIANVGDGVNWLERLTASKKTFNVPVISTSNLVALGSGCFGCGPFVQSGTQVTDFGTGSNFTAIGGSFTYASNPPHSTATWLSAGGPGFSKAAWTANTFNASQYAQAKITSLGSGSANIGVCLRMNGTVGNWTSYCYIGGSSSSLIIKYNAAGTPTTLESGLPALVVGDTIYFTATGTSTTTLTAYQNGILVGTPATDSSSPFTSGLPGFHMQITTTAQLSDWRAGDLSNSTVNPITVQDLTVNGICTNCGSSLVSAVNAEDLVGTGATSGTSTPRACVANVHASGDICADIAWCYAGTGGPGVTSTSAGIIDARGYAPRSNLVCNQNPFAGGNRGGVVLWPNADIYVSKTIIVPQKKMRNIGVGQSSPVGTAGNQLSNENTQFRPCTGVNTPVTGCTGSIQQTSNKLFVEPTYSATATNASGSTAVFTTSVNHNYTFTSGSVDSHIKVTGCSVTNYNNGSGGNPTLYFNVIAATANTISVTIGTSGNGAATGCTIQAPPRQHGRYSATGSGLTNAGDYYAMWAIGGQQTASGYDGNGTCGTGPVGANWTLSAFGETLEDMSLSADGVSGLILAYSGNMQERSGFKNVTFNNYGGITAGQNESNGIMMDRNAWNLNDACSNASGNGGPSHFFGEHVFCDASPVSNPGGPGASDKAGVCAQLAGNHSESDASSIEDGGSVGGLAHYGFFGGSTVRGLNDSGNGKSNYGFWIQNYDDGLIADVHFENMFHDPVYIGGISGWTTKGWMLRSLDFASSSGSNNAIMHLDTGTDANMGLNLRGAVGANPAAVRDEVNGCGVAFGAAAPCIINGLTDGNPASLYVQGGQNVYNTLIFGKQATGLNPSISSGTGAPSGACVSGSQWLRTDGASPNAYDCINSAWVGRSNTGTVTVVASGSLTSTAIVTGGGSQTIQTPSAGSTLDSSGNAVFAGTATATSIIGSGSNGGLQGTEGTGAGVSFGAGKDGFYPDSTNHCLHANYNNVDIGCMVAGGTAAVTSGNLVSYNGTSGYRIQDGSVVAANVVTATSAATAAKQLCTASGTSKTCSYVDFPEHLVVPAANCNNATAGPGWSLPSSNSPTAACRAGTNNLGGVLQWANNNTTTNAQFVFQLPVDWDTGTQPYWNIIYGSGANTSGTVKWTISTSCTKSDGSVSDDPAFVAESTSSGKTMAVANRMWAESAQFANVTSGNNCIGGSTVIVKVTSGNGTATSTVNVVQMTLTVPRLVTVQAN